MRLVEGVCERCSNKLLLRVVLVNVMVWLWVWCKSG